MCRRSIVGAQPRWYAREGLHEMPDAARVTRT